MRLIAGPIFVLEKLFVPYSSRYSEPSGPKRASNGAPKVRFGRNIRTSSGVLRSALKRVDAIQFDVNSIMKRRPSNHSGNFVVDGLLGSKWYIAPACRPPPYSSGHGSCDV